MQSIWFDCADDNETYRSNNSQTHPFLGVFNADPLELAQYIPRPVTPFQEPRPVVPFGFEKSANYVQSMTLESPVGCPEVNRYPTPYVTVF